MNFYHVKGHKLLKIDDVRDLRALMKMTQAQFAEFYGVPKRTLERWEAGRSLPPAWVFRLMIEHAQFYQPSAFEGALLIGYDCVADSLFASIEGNRDSGGEARG